MIALQIPINGFVLGENACYMIWNARQHYSPAVLEQRAKNRIAWMEARYPDRRIILA